MDPVQIPLRKSLENQMVRTYLNFKPPKAAPHFLLSLPNKYLFTDSAGYEEFCGAFELEYEQNRPDEALQLYETACRLGHPLANYCYGLWFLAGDRPNVAKDLRKAFQKFCFAHRFGIGLATYQLADFYRTGKGKVVARDANKCFVFLLQSVLDPRVHWLLDEAPFFLLGLAYGLGRGPATSSVTEAARWLDRACRYVAFQQRVSGAGPSGDLSCLCQLCSLVIRLDGDETKRQVALRLDALEKYMNQLPPAQSMMSLVQFNSLAKKFGLDYDEYLSSLNGKEGRRVTWKSFRRRADGLARPLYSYEKQSEIEHWSPMEPDDAELRMYLSDLEARCSSLSSESADEDYGFQVYSTDFSDTDVAAMQSLGIKEGPDYDAGLTECFVEQDITDNLASDITMASNKTGDAGGNENGVQEGQ